MFGGIECASNTLCPFVAKQWFFAILKLPIGIDNMIIASKRKPEVLLADMSWWTMIKNAPLEIYQNYKLLCPPIFYAENYHDIKTANKRFKTPYEVIGILPWLLLAKNELEGKEILPGSIIPFSLKTEQDMDSEEKNIMRDSKNIIKTFDKNDQQTFQSEKATPKDLNYLGNFGNAPHQNLTWDQFFRKFKEDSRESVFEELIPVIEQQPDKNKARTAIEGILGQCSEQYPINTFKKAYKMSQSILQNSFIDVCNLILISEFERIGIEFDNTHWNNNRDYLLSNPKSYSSRFPYTSYTLHLEVAFTIYRIENSHNRKIKSRVSLRDFEYLYYTYFPNVLFVSMDKQHQIYIKESEILKSRLHGSFVYIPHKNDDPDKYDKGMRYIQYGSPY